MCCVNTFLCFPPGARASPSAPICPPPHFGEPWPCIVVCRTVPNAAKSGGVLISPAVQRLDSSCLSVSDHAPGARGPARSTTVFRPLSRSRGSWSKLAGVQLDRLIREERSEETIPYAQVVAGGQPLLFLLLIKKAASQLCITGTTDSPAEAIPHGDPPGLHLRSL